MSRYQATYVDPAGPGDARPTAQQIVKDNGQENKLIGKIGVVTGVSSGIGIETVRSLTTTGMTLYLLARDPDAAKTVLGGAIDPGRTHFVKMDNSDFASVRSAAEAILAKTDRVNLLINNAGILAIPERTLTKDGQEIQFQTNYLSHCLLFQLLRPALLKATTPEFQSRVVNVSSDAHRPYQLNGTGNYSFENGGYEAWQAYGQSKLAMIYMASEIERRYGSQGLHGLSVHPGFVATNLGRSLPKEQIEAMLANPVALKNLQNPEQGAATTIYAAISNEWEGKGGRYLTECSEAQRGEDNGSHMDPTYCSNTYDPENESRLWGDSLKLVGLSHA